MSSGQGELQLATDTTEITVAIGERYRVEGDLKDVERVILDAARGSIMQLAWLIDAETRDDLVDYKTQTATTASCTAAARITST